jgi:hypothetical protein
MFRIDSLALTTDSVLVELRHPVTEELLKDEGKAVGIWVYGTASEQYRNAVSAMQNRALKRQKGKATAEEMKEETIRLLVAVSEKGENLEYDGKPLKDAETFRSLYADPRFSWVKDQVDAAVGETANFLDQSAKS